MANDGIKNEHKIISQLHNHKYEHINNNLQKFLQFIFSFKISPKERIFSKKLPGADKSDICIQINNEKHFISVKIGSGNSIHQEKLEEFISFLSKNFEVETSVLNDIKFFIWGDGTLDGSGKIEERLNAREINKKYPDKVKNIQTFFNFHKKELIQRFLIDGSTNQNNKPEYIYYGNDIEGTYISALDALNWLADKHETNISNIPIGKTTFQAWNRNINGGSKSEHKRGEIQVKWGKIGQNIKEIAEGKYGE
ncbi:hypothetical protein [Methanobrevibacter curvatus]|uniref:Uncharacterized protein n=1 Tax=Methanobrevibacter curvatus TaxID=49547 RepID=A0A166B5C0_9EURY|nr:hypothetical protein [Methanobrevibacter curvatus]KZX12883.1 hypothetical protein MBCUR_08440 [Methanobrevibacter curvatus]